MAQTRVAPTRADDEWLGHPRGLAPLFFTEMWERFSYYGMRALLVLFMVGGTSAANEGLGFGEGTAATVYGLYSSMVYLLALPGGWLADKLWGQQRAVWVGAWVITAGHFTLAAPLVGVPFLLVAYFLHTVGELCLSPVGLSTVTKWAPADRTSQMMGLWFVASAIGSLFAGLTAARLENLAPADLFRNVGLSIGARARRARRVAAGPPGGAGPLNERLRETTRGKVPPHG